MKHSEKVDKRSRQERIPIEKVESVQCEACRLQKSLNRSNSQHLTTASSWLSVRAQLAANDMANTRRLAPWIERRDNGIYYVQWYDPKTRQTRRASLGTDSQREAVQAFQRFIAERHTAKHHRRGSHLVKTPILERRPGPNALSVAEVLNLYLENHVAENNLDKDRGRYAAQHLRWFFGNVPISQVDVRRSAAYTIARRKALVQTPLKSHRGRPASNSTIRRELNCLNAASRWARKHGHIRADQMPTIELPPETPGRKVFLSVDELEFVHQTAGPLLRDFVMLGYLTGARRRAIEALTPAQIDFAARQICLMPANATALEKNSKKRRAVVPIFDDCLPLLRRLCAGKAPHETLLPKADYYGMFKKHLETLKLFGKAFPHILRHSRATHLLQARVSLYDVGWLLGDTVATVQRNYGHHDVDTLRRSTEGKGAKLVDRPPTEEERVSVPHRGRGRPRRR